jgi:hypothetical protein
MPSNCCGHRWYPRKDHSVTSDPGTASQTHVVDVPGQSGVLSATWHEKLWPLAEGVEIWPLAEGVEIWPLAEGVEI